MKTVDKKHSCQYENELTELIALYQQALKANRSLFILVQYDHEKDKQKFINELANHIEFNPYDPKVNKQHSTTKLYPLLESDASENKLSIISSIPLDLQNERPDKNFIQYINLQRDRITRNKLHFVLFIPTFAVAFFINNAPDLWDFRHQTFWLERDLPVINNITWQQIRAAKAMLKVIPRSEQQICERIKETEQLVNDTLAVTDKAQAYLNLARWLLNSDAATQAIEAAFNGIYSLEGQVLPILAELEAILGEAHKQLGQYKDAIAHSRKSLSIGNQFDNCTLQANILGHIAQIYQALEDYYSATHYYNLALEKANEQHTLEVIAQVTINLASLHIEQQAFDTALILLEKIQNLAQDKQDQILQGELLNLTAQCYLYKQQLANAQTQLERALVLLQEAGDDTAQAVVCENLALIYQLEQQYDRALQFNHCALNIANDTGNKIQASNILWKIAAIYGLKGDAESYLAKLKQLQNSKQQVLINQQFCEQVSKLNAKQLLALCWRELIRALCLTGDKSLNNIWPSDTSSQHASSNSAGVHYFRIVWSIIIIYRAILKEQSIPTTSQKLILNYVNYAVKDAQDACIVLISKLITCCLIISEGDQALGKQLLSESLIFTDAAWQDLNKLLNDNLQTATLLATPLIAKLLPMQAALITQMQNIGLKLMTQDLKQLWQGKRLSSDGEYYDVMDLAKDNLRALINQYPSQHPSYTYGMNVVILGDSGAGKTTLAHSIYSNNKREKYSKADNQYISKFKCKLADFNPTQKVSTTEKIKRGWMELWDFGQQSLINNINWAFKHKQHIYIVLINNKQRTKPDPWLQQIKYATNNKAKVMVVTNSFNGVKKSELNHNKLIQQYPNLLNDDSFFYIDCSNAHSLDFQLLLDSLTNTCIDSKYELQNNTELAISFVEQLKKESNCIYINELEEKLTQYIEGLTTFQSKKLIDKLYEFGRIIPVDSFGELLCINPNWLIQNCIELFKHLKKSKNKGTVSYQLIKTAFSHNQDIAKIVVAFLIQQSQCSEIKSRNQLNKTYFFPALAPENKPSSLSNKQTLFKTAKFTYNLTQRPFNIFAKLVTELLTDKSIVIDVEHHVWQEGLIISSPSKEENRLIVELLLDQHIISLTIIGKHPIILATLLERFDVALERVCDRTIVGYLVHQNRKNQAERPIEPTDIRPFIESIVPYINK